MSPQPQPQPLPVNEIVALLDEHNDLIKQQANLRAMLSAVEARLRVVDGEIARHWQGAAAEHNQSPDTKKQGAPVMRRRPGRPPTTILPADEDDGEVGRQEAILRELRRNPNSKAPALAAAVYGNDSWHAVQRVRMLLYHLKEKGLATNPKWGQWTAVDAPPAAASDDDAT